MAKGWFAVARKIRNWEWYSDPATTKIWFDCMAQAYFANGEWRGIKIKKGQFPTTTETLATLNGLTIQQTRTALKNLQTTNEIEIQTTNRYSIITVKNFEFYQGTNKQKTNSNNKQNGGSNNKPNNNNINNITNNSNTSYINISLSNNKKITKGEREILEKYLLKQKRKYPIDDIDAYISTLSKNGDLENKLEKAKQWQERQKKKEEDKKLKEVEKVEITPEEDEKIRAIQEQIKKRGKLRK